MDFDGMGLGSGPDLPDELPGLAPADLDVVAPVFRAMLMQYIDGALPFFDPNIAMEAIQSELMSQPIAPMTGLRDELGFLEGRAHLEPLTGKAQRPAAPQRWQYVGRGGGACTIIWDPNGNHFRAEHFLGSDYSPAMARLHREPTGLDRERVHHYFLIFELISADLPDTSVTMLTPKIGRSVTRRVKGGRSLGEYDPIVPYVGGELVLKGKMSRTDDLLDFAKRRFRPAADPRFRIDGYPNKVDLHPRAYSHDLARTSGYLAAVAAQQWLDYPPAPNPFDLGRAEASDAWLESPSLDDSGKKNFGIVWPIQRDSSEASDSALPLPPAQPSPPAKAPAMGDEAAEPTTGKTPGPAASTGPRLTGPPADSPATDTPAPPSGISSESPPVKRRGGPGGRGPAGGAGPNPGPPTL